MWTLPSRLTRRYLRFVGTASESVRSNLLWKLAELKLKVRDFDDELADLEGGGRPWIMVPYPSLSLKFIEI
jgi:hypothetical protein